jgi:glycosyltransferase involved in cell wall biosynthesis
MDSSPFFSIITVVRNGEKYIKETIESVISQTFCHFEYIIIDANSTDSTNEIISEYRNYLAFYISEPDQNMYDGINKGIRQAKGEFLLVLNSDDILLHKDVLKQVHSLILADEKYHDGYYFNIELSRNNQIIKKYLFQINFWILLYSRHCSFVPHCSLFIKSKVYQNTNGYDICFKYASDYDFILKILKLGYKLKHFKSFTTRFREHPNSFTSNNVIEKERIPIIKKYGLKQNLITYFLFCLIWIYYKITLKIKTLFY